MVSIFKFVFVLSTRFAHKTLEIFQNQNILDSVLQFIVILFL